MIALLLAAQLVTTQPLAVDCLSGCARSSEDVQLIQLLKLCKSGEFLAALEAEGTVACGALGRVDVIWAGFGSITMPMPPKQAQQEDQTRATVPIGSLGPEMNICADCTNTPASRLETAHAICERHHGHADIPALNPYPPVYYKGWESCRTVELEWAKGDKAFVEGVAKSLEQQK